MTDNTRKYILYAIGEIALVMIGILLALQINNWNQERIENIQLDNYFNRINEELKAGLPIQIGFLEQNQQIIKLNRRTLQLLNSDNPDSLHKLQFTLGAIATAWSSSISLPVMTEFISNGYLSKVENQTLKQKFTELNAGIEYSRKIDGYIVTQYLNTIEPYVIRSFNYQKIALDQYQDLLVAGGPDVNYKALKGDIELWNITTLKLENSLLYEEYLTDLISRQKELSLLLEEELK